MMAHLIIAAIGIVPGSLTISTSTSARELASGITSVVFGLLSLMMMFMENEGEDEVKPAMEGAELV